MPHKSSIVALLDELTPDAQVVGAVKVVRRSADGRLRGTMLDGEGFVAGLRSAGHEVKGMSCLLVGAGGTAAAIAFALARHGCAALTIRNRTVARATSLAAWVRQASSSVDVQVAADERGSYDMLINATSVGMNDDGEMPVPAAVIERSGLVAECVVAPEVTPLLRLARTIGRPIHTGVPMLTAQIDLMSRFMGVE
jgi:shikimate dehydrogenase